VKNYKDADDNVYVYKHYTDLDKNHGTFQLCNKVILNVTHQKYNVLSVEKLNVSINFLN
jgi:hypothetical protein